MKNESEALSLIFPPGSTENRFFRRLHAIAVEAFEPIDGSQYEELIGCIETSGKKLQFK